MEEKTQIEDINHEFYNFRYEESEKDFYRIKSGLTPEIVKKISEEKGDPEWMKEFRLKSLEIYNQLKVPKWGGRRHERNPLINPLNKLPVIRTEHLQDSKEDQAH